jgi:hypothetical protein
VENVYTQHNPLIKETLEELIKGKLKENCFPYLGNGQLMRRYVTLSSSFLVVVIGGSSSSSCSSSNSSSGGGGIASVIIIITVLSPPIIYTHCMFIPHIMVEWLALLLHVSSYLESAGFKSQSRDQLS